MRVCTGRRWHSYGMSRDLLTSWNRTATPWPEEACVHELFEAQALRTPDSVAVKMGSEVWTYRELDQKANQLAHVLRERGVGPNVLVGICLDRSIDLIVAVYATLKAGGAYVPLDPRYPKDRLDYMIQSAGLRVLLTHREWVSVLPEREGVHRLVLDESRELLAASPTTAPPPSAKPNHLIYVIFTSGSTGTPKAAAVYHSGFTNLLHWFTTEFSITSADRSLLVSSVSFDLTQKNLYAVLLSGGTLHLLPPGPYDVSSWTRCIQDGSITLLNCTPSAFYPLIEPIDDNVARQLSSLRVVFLGGESISIARVRPWMEHPQTRAEIANTYGPTECTDICGAYRLTRSNLDLHPFVPLGRPIFNVQLVVVDPEGQPCEVGVSGELLVGGAGVGAGYLNDPVLSSTKFIPNPFPEISSRLLYRTGDQARWLPDGKLEFLGRLDSQVKIRGYRIELQEIEQTLERHSNVKEAVVVVSNPMSEGTHAEDARLSCYFTAQPPGSISVALLKRFADDALPDYMVPARFIEVSQFPLSPNGKVDRKALASRALQESIGKRPEAGGGLEGRIQEMWIQVLRREQIGIDDSFFDLHGNSLQLAQLHVLMEKEFQREFPITDLFAHTTIRAQAKHFGAPTTSSVNSASASASAQNQQHQDRARRQREALQAKRLPRR